MIPLDIYEQQIRRMESCLEGVRWNKAKNEECYDLVKSFDPDDLVQAVTNMIKTEDRSSIRKLINNVNTVRLGKWNKIKQREAIEAQKFFHDDFSKKPEMVQKYMKIIIGRLIGIVTQKELIQFMYEMGHDEGAIELENMTIGEVDLSDIPF